MKISDLEKALAEKRAEMGDINVSFIVASDDGENGFLVPGAGPMGFAVMNSEPTLQIEIPISAEHLNIPEYDEETEEYK